VGATGRERVEAALRLDVADRPPVSAWGHSYDREWDPASLASATVEAARRHSLDFVKLQIRASCFSEAFGARWRYSGEPEREPVEEGAPAPGPDWRRIAAGEHDPRPLHEQVEALTAVVGELGDDVPVLQTVFSPGMVAWFLSGRDVGRLAGLSRQDPGLARAALAAIGEVLAGFAAGSIKAGAAGVFYAINPLADLTVVTPAEYEETYLAADRVAVAGADGGWFNMLHLCSGHVDQSLVDRLPMHCVNWSTHDAGNPHLAEMLESHRRAVAGGLHRYALIDYQDPERIRAEASAALATTAGRAHLLTPGCSSSPWSRVRQANIDAFVEAAGAPR
jgi:uroporphyrinogen decarboxylase